MDNIVDLIRSQQMNEATPTPTEKSQIVIVWTTPQPPNIQRFSSVKKGQKEYDKLKKAWALFLGPWDPKKQPPNLHDIDGDMFFSTVDLANVAGISFVDQAKRNKFIPI